MSSNPGNGGIRGVFRAENGQWIFGFCQKFENITNVAAKLLAIRGLQLAVLFKIEHLIILQVPSEFDPNMCLNAYSPLKEYAGWLFG